MTSVETRAVASALIDGYIQDTLDGLILSAQTLESHPGDRQVGSRVQSHLITLDRLYAVRRGLRDR